MDKAKNRKLNFYVAIIIDIFMMILLVMNLSLILFDALYSISIVNEFFAGYAPRFYNFYKTEVHLRFVEIDLIFVSVFLSEFILSWILAIVNKEYYRWFFYPFIHWYDLIGCIPVGSFRVLRVLRIFSILIRLQNLKIVDLSKTYLFKKFQKYYRIVVEEVSDRVVVNILEGVQEEIEDGGPVVEKIVSKVIRPRKEVLVEWVSRRIEFAVEKNVIIKKHDLEAYVNELVSKSLAENSELQSIELLPVMGKIIKETIEKSISSTINSAIDQLLTDLASNRNRELVNDVTEVILHSIEYEDHESGLDEVFKDISIEVIEIIKKQVKIQKWKIKEEMENSATETQQKNIEFLMADKD